MSGNWYYALEQDRQGPVDDGEVARLSAAGVITPQTLVWTTGMEGWQGAQEALPPHLRPASWPGGNAAGAPPLPPRANAPVSTTAGTAYGGQGSYHPDGFQDSVRAVFQRYATFSGRARRPEYWWFVLFNFIVSGVLGLVGNILLGSDGDILSALYSLVVLVPSLAVAVRRLHDLGRTGWWLLIGLVPLVGLIVLIVFFATKGEEQDNQYGPA